jgi:hypothetical protein
MQREQRPWCRRRWEIIDQALKAPRKAEDIAKTVGVSVATVHQVMFAYKRGGEAAIQTPGKGGRRREHLTLEHERAFLQPFAARLAQGEKVTVFRSSAQVSPGLAVFSHHQTGQKAMLLGRE